MTDYLSIGEAAKAVHTTSETLRHYDRIGLVKPSKKDEWTNYRYYTQQDLVRLNTVRALQLMGLPLQEIKNVMEYDDLEKIVEFLAQAERKADEKIAALQYSKSKIQLAKADYEKKLKGRQKLNQVSLKDYPERVILLSDTLKEPALENLWNYLGHFYDKLPLALKEKFSTEENRTRTLEELTGIARTKYGAEPDFTVQLIVVSGILQWTYEAQVYVGG